jgi:hypothetical protein
VLAGFAFASPSSTPSPVSAPCSARRHPLTPDGGHDDLAAIGARFGLASRWNRNDEALQAGIEPAVTACRTRADRRHEPWSINSTPVHHRCERHPRRPRDSFAKSSGTPEGRSHFTVHRCSRFRVSGPSSPGTSPALVQQGSSERQIPARSDTDRTRDGRQHRVGRASRAQVVVAHGGSMLARIEVGAIGRRSGAINAMPCIGKIDHTDTQAFAVISALIARQSSISEPANGGLCWEGDVRG